MARLSDAEVDAVARRLAAQMTSAALGVPEAAAVSRQAVAAEPARAAAGEGVFATVDDCVRAATTAFHRLEQLTLATRVAIIAAVRDAMRRHGDELARLAWEETGLGRLEHKVIKNRLVTDRTPGAEILVPETVTGDAGLTLTEWAPFGVIGSITPTTNPTSTVICNTIGMVAAGNSVVFNVHPGAARCSTETIRLLNRAIVSAGGPPDLVTAVARPTIESATELMHHPGIDLLVVTGGPGVVAAAMASGKRAICAGPGNPPVVVDDTADPAKAARDVVHGAGFDNNIICVDEKEVFVVDRVAGALLDHMRRAGAHLLSASELRRLEPEIFATTHGPRQHAVIRKELVGKNAADILARIGGRCAADTPLLVADVDENHPLVWTEQLMPVLPVVRVADVGRAIELAVEAEHGFGHSASMHSKDIDALSTMARRIDTSIFVKNGPIVAGLGAGGEGYSSFTIASPTGEGMTGPRSFSRRRRCVMVDHFRIV